MSGQSLEGRHENDLSSAGGKRRLPSILETAFIVGQKFNSYIEGLYEQPGLTEVVVANEGLGVTPPDLVETFQQQEKERAVRAHELFEAFMKEKGIPLAGRRRRKIMRPRGGSRKKLQAAISSAIAVDCSI